MPFIWSPVFLEERTKSMPHGGIYRPREGAKRLSVMEPIINVVKFCLYPALIAEMAYRQRPDDIAILQVTNAEQIARNSLEFIGLMVVRPHKAYSWGVTRHRYSWRRTPTS
jgi:hypothetical protein